MSVGRACSWVWVRALRRRRQAGGGGTYADVASVGEKGLAELGVSMLKARKLHRAAVAGAEEAAAGPAGDLAL